MKLEIVNNKVIAARLKISESRASRLVRAYRDAKELPKCSPIDWGSFCDFYKLPPNSD